MGADAQGLDLQEDLQPHWLSGLMGLHAFSLNKNETRFTPSPNLTLGRRSKGGAPLCVCTSSVP